MWWAVTEPCDARVSGREFELVLGRRPCWCYWWRPRTEAAVIAASLRNCANSFTPLLLRNGFVGYLGQRGNKSE